MMHPTEEDDALASYTDLSIWPSNITTVRKSRLNEAQNACAGTQNGDAENACACELAVGRDLQPGQFDHLVGQPCSLNLIMHATPRMACPSDAELSSSGE